MTTRHTVSTGTCVGYLSGIPVILSSIRAYHRGDAAPRSLGSPRRGRSGGILRALLICLTALMLFGTGCSLHKSTPMTAPCDGTPASVAGAARTQLGAPYKYGGISPDQGFDCSGLVCWTYAQCGITMPRTSREQMSRGRPVSRAQLRPGDLVGFRISRRRTHTGIYIGDGKFIHSPNTGEKVREESLSTPYWKSRLTAMRRIVPR